MAFYGNDTETIFENRNGELYVVQSPDLVGVKQYERIDSLPDGFERLDDALCGDIEVPPEIC